MPLTFQNSPEKISKTLDWYWNFGVKRIKDYPDYILLRGSWLDTLYKIAKARRPSPNERKTMAIWGPSQAGKSTLLSTYLDAEKSVGSSGEYSSMLTWNESEPVTFLNSNTRGIISLNPYNNGADASGCVTRYTAATSVKNNKYPVRLKFNSLSHVMHALAFGYLSECKPAKAGGTPELWTRESIYKEFLSNSGAMPIEASRSAYQLAREILDVVGMFIKSGEQRYASLAPYWESLRRDLLDSSDMTQSDAAAIHFAEKIFWDKSPTLSGTFNSLRQKVESLNWTSKEVYCTMAVAELLLDIDTFKRVNSLSILDTHAQLTLNRLYTLGFHEDDGVIYVKEAESNPEISGKMFGLFQALVREMVVPVKISQAHANEPFFKLLKECDILDFPGVALADAQGNSLTKLDLAAITETDHQLLTTVFKRGKTSSIVMGYADDVSIDAFSLLVKAQTYPAKPEQLSSGIRFWWEKIDPDFSSINNDSVKPPLPLSVCLTFFGPVLKTIGSARSPAGPGPIFKDMLEKLAPFNRPANASYFATTYKNLPSGFLDVADPDIKWAANDINSNAEFQKIFNSVESRDSFNNLIAKNDGGVGYFFSCQLEKLRSSNRIGHLEKVAARDSKAFEQLVAIAIPQSDDTGAQQLHLISQFVSTVESNLSEWDKSLPSEFRRYEQIEDSTSLYSFWIRSILAVESDELEQIPLSFAQLNRESKYAYITRQWSRWRECSVARMKKITGFNWGLLGFKDESEYRIFLQVLSEGRQLNNELVAWIADEIGFLDSEPKARILRSDLAVVMGNILREGQLRPGPRIEHPSLVEIMTQQVGWENDEGRLIDSPHFQKVIMPFMDKLKKFKPAAPKRPALPGDNELRTISQS